MSNKEFPNVYDANLYNLDSLSCESSIIFTRRTCEISEMCDIAAAHSLDYYKNGLGIYEILSLISEDLCFLCHENTGGESSHSTDFCRISDRVSFSSLYLDRLRKRGVNLTERSFLPEGNDTETFVYVKNPLSDEAYDVFSQEFFDPRVRYVKSIKDAVKAVNDGDSTYCLLPLEERGGARLSMVTELVFGNDLKIDSVTPVFGQDGGADMKYALVSKTFSIPVIEADDDRYLEILLDVDASLSLSEILTAASLFKIEPYRVNTVLLYTEDGQKTNYSVVFKGEGKDFSDILIYLTLFSGSYVPIGIYKNLE